MKKRREKIITHFRNNIKKYVVASAFLIIGIIIGSVSGTNAQSASGGENILNNFLSMYKLTGITSKEILIKSIASNLRLLVLLWISGLSVYLIPLNLCCSLLKGFGIGYTISYLICDGGTSGFVFSFISLFFQNIVIIPAMLILSVYQINYAISVRRAGMLPSGYKQRKKLRLNNLIVFIIGVFICVISGVVETGVVPTLIKLIYGNIA